MAWVRIDDRAPLHEKILKAGPSAAWLWICCLAHCQRALSDGFVSSRMLGMIGVPDAKRCERLADVLVGVGLLEQIDGGYQLHDYLQYQPSAAQVDQKKKKAAARVANWKVAHGHVGEPAGTHIERAGNGVTGDTGTHLERTGNAQSNTAPIPIPIPVPIPIPISTKNSNAGPRRERAEPPTQTREAFEAFFISFQQNYGVKPALDRKKDGERMKHLLLEAGGFEEVRKRIDAFFDSHADPFFAKCSHTLDVFFSAGTQTKLTIQLRGSSHARINGCRHEPPCQTVAEHYQADQREYEERETARAGAR